MVLEQPAGEFWTTPPKHFWWLLEAKKEQSDAIKEKMGEGGEKLGPKDYKRLRKMMDEHNVTASY